MRLLDYFIGTDIAISCLSFKKVARQFIQSEGLVPSLLSDGSLVHGRNYLVR